ncbi:hypothetical protein PR048_014713 [Dryococelus australis]|uniref:Uncharacterized protein n=1 Tax=Dryococelus australis TaxID=614101 RepID=A0ABQ9HF47_9NEOP|nr:hypothetical protein PR048_014713 [Dryococelus australis]
MAGSVLIVRKSIVFHQFVSIESFSLPYVPVVVMARAAGEIADLRENPQISGIVQNDLPTYENQGRDTAQESSPVHQGNTNARFPHRGSKIDPRSDLRLTQKTVAPFEFRAGLEIEMKFSSHPKFVSYFISISHFRTKIDESETPNHEISLVQHFYIGTKIKLDPGSELGSFDLGSGNMLVQPGISAFKTFLMSGVGEPRRIFVGGRAPLGIVARMSAPRLVASGALTTSCGLWRRRSQTSAPGVLIAARFLPLRRRTFVTGLRFIRYALCNSAPVNEHFAVVFHNHVQVSQKGGGFTSAQKPLEKQRLLQYIHSAKYNKGRIDNPFRAVDLVLWKARPVSSAVDKKMAKISYRWSGPYQIQRFLTPVTVALADLMLNFDLRALHEECASLDSIPNSVLSVHKNLETNSEKCSFDQNFNFALLRLEDNSSTKRGMFDFGGKVLTVFGTLDNDDLKSSEKRKRLDSIVDTAIGEKSSFKKAGSRGGEPPAIYRYRVRLTHFIQGGISLWSGSRDTKVKPKMKDKDSASRGKKVHVMFAYYVTFATPNMADYVNNRKESTIAIRSHTKVCVKGDEYLKSKVAVSVVWTLVNSFMDRRPVCWLRLVMMKAGVTITEEHDTTRQTNTSDLNGISYYISFSVHNTPTISARQTSPTRRKVEIEPTFVGLSRLRICKTDVTVTLLFVGCYSDFVVSGCRFGTGHCGLYFQRDRIDDKDEQDEMCSLELTANYAFDRQDGCLAVEWLHRADPRRWSVVMWSSSCSDAEDIGHSHGVRMEGDDKGEIEHEDEGGSLILVPAGGGGGGWLRKEMCVWQGGGTEETGSTEVRRSELDRSRRLDALPPPAMHWQPKWSPVVLGRHRSSIPRWPPGMRSSEFERSSDCFSCIAGRLLALLTNAYVYAPRIGNRMSQFRVVVGVRGRGRRQAPSSATSRHRDKRGISLVMARDESVKRLVLDTTTSYEVIPLCAPNRSVDAPGSLAQDGCHLVPLPCRVALLSQQRVRIYEQCCNLLLLSLAPPLCHDTMPCTSYGGSFYEYLLSEPICKQVWRFIWANLSHEACCHACAFILILLSNLQYQDELHAQLLQREIPEKTRLPAARSPSTKIREPRSARCLPANPGHSVSE